MQYGLPTPPATAPLNIGTTHITNLEPNPPTQHSTTSEDSDDGNSLHLVSRKFINIFYNFNHTVLVIYSILHVNISTWVYLW